MADLEQGAPASVGAATDTNQEIIISLLDNYAVIVAEDSGDSNVSYAGSALIGSATSAASWQIRKIDETTGIVVTWADGDDSFDNIWDNRESLTYG